jgi:VanZ family protein
VTACLFVVTLWTIYLANAGQSNALFDLVEATPNGDKFVHFMVFGFLALASNLTTKFKRVTIFNQAIFAGSTFVLLFAVIEEFSQFYSPNRTLDMLDLCANVAGISLFTLLTHHIKNYKSY